MCRKIIIFNIISYTQILKENENYIHTLKLERDHFSLLSFYVVLFIFIAVWPIQAQQNLNSKDASNFLDEHLGKENLPVFNGVRFYDLLQSNNKDFRYFERYKPFKATIVYNNKSYHNILTRYDLLKDHLIVYTEGKISFFQVQLANERINAFQLDSLDFVRLDLSTKYTKEKNAFYEMAYTGDYINLFAAWSKAENLKTNTQNPYYTFKVSQEYYFQKKEEYFKINNRTDVIELFPEFKSEIKAFYKAYSNIDKKDPKQFMRKLALYLDQTLKN